MSKIYDLIILGAGPAGLTAGIYAGRGRLSTLIIEKGQDGGQIATTSEIDNYPGQMTEGETGPSLVRRMTKQAEKFGCERATDSITAAELDGPVKKLTGSKGEYLCRALIIASGAHPKNIGCENEDKYRGQGISYCATCDGAFFEDLDIYVVGGGDAAVEEALYLTKFGRKVTIIHRRDALRAAKSIQEKAFNNPKIDFMWDTVVQSVGGDDVLSTMTVKNVKTGDLTTIEASPEDGMFGLFGFIGLAPNSALFEGKLNMENGYILTDEDMHTSLPGVFAAGDIRKKSLRQVITAAADGAIAAMQAEHYISEL